MNRLNKILSIFLAGMILLASVGSRISANNIAQAKENIEYVEIVDDGMDEACLDIIKVFCAHDDEKLYFKTLVIHNLLNPEDFGLIHIVIDSDLDAKTGIKKTADNYGGEDHLISILTSKAESFGELIELKEDEEDEKIADIELFSDGDILELSVKLEDLNNPEGIRFFVHTMCPEVPETEDRTEFGLVYSLTGEEILERCNIAPPHLVSYDLDNMVKLSWKPIEEKILGINVYRTENDEEFIKINPEPLIPTEVEFIDPDAMNNNTYKYYITVICENGSEGEISNIVTGKPKEKLDKAIIHFDPKTLDFGSRLYPFGETKKLKIKNDGNIVFEGLLSCDADWIDLSENDISIGVGGLIEIEVKIADNLIAGTYQTNVMLTDIGGIFIGKVPVNVIVPKSSTQTKFVRSLIATPEINGIYLKWNPPTYNHEKLLKYVIRKTEQYGGKIYDDFEYIELSSTETDFKDEGIFSESEFSYSVVPIYKSGEGVPRKVSINPLPSPIWISMTIGSKSATVNGESTSLDVEPTIISGRTVVPFRFLGEALNADVSYEAETKTAIFKKGRKTIRIPIGKSTASIDDNEVEIEPPATIKDGRTLVPLRFVSEAFDSEVKWNGEKRSIDIFYPNLYRPEGWIGE